MASDQAPIFDNNKDIANEINNEKAQKPQDSSDEHSETTKTAEDPNLFNNKEGGRSDGKVEITEEDCYDELGYSYPNWKKWMILTVIFWVQVSMNFNSSLYSNGLKGISKQFGVSEQAARCGAAIFLVTYAFGCELWAPWSEEFGRKPILQLSLFLVNIWQLPVALAPNFASILVGRALGGLSSAGGSVTLGMIADMWESDTQQYAVAYVVFSSVGGSILGPVIGGFCEQWLAWQWTIWIQLIFGGFIQAVHLLLVPETRSTIIMDRVAKRKRKSGESPNLYGPNELEPFRERLSVKEILVTWMRPFRMFLTEPIVLVLSLLSGFSDALVFMFIQAFSLVYKLWDFNAVEIGLSFCAIGVGYIIAWISFLPVIKRNIKMRHDNPDNERIQYESRLWWLLYTAPCLPIGLFIFAWTSTGPPLHWIGSSIGAAIVGIANYAIYMATIDYMICAYGPYSASATGGNGWSRDFLAGILTVPATPYFTSKIPLSFLSFPTSNIFTDIGKSAGGTLHLAYASTILACIATVLVCAVYVIYWKGPVLRARSPFAQQLADSRNNTDGRRLSYISSAGARKASSAGGYHSANRRTSYARFQQTERVRSATGSRRRSSAYGGGSARQSRQTSQVDVTNRDFAQNADKQV